jgi:hypothetical protein
VGLLKGAGTTHIILIDEYLYTRYKELLSIPLLADNHKGMLAAWEFLASLPHHEAYFAKILYDKEATACLNRNNFPLHISAAVAAARFETPSMVNYRGTESQIQSSVLVGNIVTQYLTRRLNLSTRADQQLHPLKSTYEVMEYHRTVNSSAVDTTDSSSPDGQRGQPIQIQQPPVRE